MQIKSKLLLLPVLCMLLISCDVGNSSSVSSSTSESVDSISIAAHETTTEYDFSAIDFTEGTLEKYIDRSALVNEANFTFASTGYPGKKNATGEAIPDAPIINAAEANDDVAEVTMKNGVSSDICQAVFTVKTYPSKTATDFDDIESITIDYSKNGGASYTTGTNVYPQLVKGVSTKLTAYFTETRINAVRLTVTAKFAATKTRLGVYGLTLYSNARATISSASALEYAEDYLDSLYGVSGAKVCLNLSTKVPEYDEITFVYSGSDKVTSDGVITRSNTLDVDTTVTVTVSLYGNVIGTFEYTFTIESQNVSRLAESYKDLSYGATRENPYLSEDLNFLHTKGVAKILVLPIQFDSYTTIPTAQNPSVTTSSTVDMPQNYHYNSALGYTTQNASEKIHDDIEATFLGDPGVDTQIQWESLASYFGKSSDGVLTIEGDVADWYTAEYSAYSYVGGVSSVSSLIDNVIANGTVGGQPIDVADYDGDNDGAIDAVYVVYCHETDYDNNFWAWVSSYSNDNLNLNRYMWAGLDFIYDNQTETPKPNTVYSDTFLHETGHIMGLDDYYDYNNTTEDYGIGGVDMMYSNAGDHNPFSKALFGWANLKVVTYADDLTIDLNKFEDDNSTIIVTPQWSDDTGIFSEYYMIQYYTPTGLNEYNLTYGWYHTFSEPGIIIYHVDGNLNKNGYGNPNSHIVSGNITAESTYANSIFENDNSDSYYDSNHQKLIKMIDAESGELVGDKYELIADAPRTSGRGPVGNSSLFQAGDDFGITTYETYSMYDEDYSNFHWTMSVNSLGDTASLTFNITR